MLDLKSNVVEITSEFRKDRLYKNSNGLRGSRVLPFVNVRETGRPRRLKILIAHHQPIMILGIAAVIERAGHGVAATCRRPSDLEAAFTVASPDLVVLAASFCERNEPFMRRLKLRDQLAATIVIGEEAPIEQIGDYMAEGVGGIVTAPAEGALLSCVRAVAGGRRWVDADFRDRWRQLQLRRSG
jgi:DNA-binding NarL/FixJ family response regulator